MAAGFIMFNDRFDTGALPWKVTNGTGAIARTTTDAEVSSYGGAMKLTTSLVGAEATELHRFMARAPDASRYVFGGRFAAMDENTANFAFYLGYRDGTNWIRAKLLHTFSSNLWQWDAGGTGAAALTTLLTRDTSEVSNRAVWHTFSMCADFTANTHEEFLIDDQDFTSTVDGRSLRIAADTAAPNLLDFAIETTNLGGSPSAGVILFDHLYGVAITGDATERPFRIARDLV